MFTVHNYDDCQIDDTTQYIEYAGQGIFIPFETVNTIYVMKYKLISVLLRRLAVCCSNMRAMKWQTVLSKSIVCMTWNQRKISMNLNKLAQASLVFSF